MLYCSSLSIPEHPSVRGVYMKGTIKKPTDMALLNQYLSASNEAIILFLRDIISIEKKYIQDFYDICMQYKKKSSRIVFVDVPEIIAPVFEEMALQENFDMYSTLPKAIEELDLV